MAWRVFSISTSGWGSRVEVFPTAMPWARALNGGKAGRTSFAVGDPGVAETANKTTLAPWKRALVLDWNGNMMYAGLITDATYSRDTQTVDVDHSDLWELWKHRLMAIQKSAGVEATAPLDFSGLTPATVAKKIIQRSTNPGPAGLDYSVPISFQNDVASADVNKYFGYNLPLAADALDDIMAMDGGPDIDFMPKWGAGASLAWDMRTGNLTDGLWEWDVSAPESEVSGLTEILSGANLANNIIGAGEGSEKKLLVRSAHAGGSPYLALDRVSAHKDESDGNRLQRQINGELTLSGSPTEQVSFSVRADGVHQVSDLMLGGTVRWHVQDDPWLADGWREYRLIEFSGDLTNTVKLQFQTNGA